MNDKQYANLDDADWPTDDEDWRAKVRPRQCHHETGGTMRPGMIVKAKARKRSALAKASRRVNR